MSPRRDRTGEPIDGDEPTPPPPRRAGHSCDSGWIDRDADNPVPCLICKPWLAPSELAKHIRPEGAM